MKINNMLTYAQTEFDTFDMRPFCEVDALILSWLSYIHFPAAMPELESPEGLPITDLLRAEYFGEMFTLPISPDLTKELFLAVCFSPRFRKIRICFFRHKLDSQSATQFAAVSFRLSDDLTYCAFRGTDATFVGWKEDFLLSIDGPISSQSIGVRYLIEAAAHYPGKLMAGGHSKGGNVAVYSAVNCIPALGDRIAAIYSFDGPGFKADDLPAAPLKEAEGRIYKLIPQSSLIGTIFQQECDVRIVKSDVSAPQQHNPFNWQLEGTDFVVCSELTTQAKIIDRTLTELLSRLSDEDRKHLTDLIFDMLDKTGAESFTGFGKIFLKNLPMLAGEVTSLDKETLKLVTTTLQSLVSLSVNNTIKEVTGQDESAET